LKVLEITLVSDRQCKVILMDENMQYQGIASRVDEEEIYGFGFDDDLYLPLSKQPMKIHLLVRLLIAVVKGEKVDLPVEI
jgi:hypothetical protein